MLGCLGGVVVLLAVLAGAWALFDRPRGARHEALAMELTDAIDTFERQRWERPVLRGTPEDGNALEAQRRALEEHELTSLPGPPFDDIEAVLRGDRPAPHALVALLDRHRDGLAAYRAATQRRWAWGDFDVYAGANAALPPYLDDMRASRLLLVHAMGSPPDRCLRIGADVLRLGQDRSAGMGLVPLMIHRHLAEQAFVVMSECLQRAGPDALRQADRELTILARHPAPTGSAMELEALILGATFANQLAAAPGVPTDWRGLQLWWHADSMLDAWDLFMGDPATRRAWGNDYPADFERVERWRQDAASSGNAFAEAAVPDYRVYLVRDASTRAMVRLLLAGARVRRAHPSPPTDSPSTLEAPILVDPRTGEPFDWFAEGSSARLRSPRPEGPPRDDPGGEGEPALELRVSFEGASAE